MVLSAFQRGQERHTQAPSAGEGRGLHHARHRPVERIDLGPQPRPERFARHSVMCDAVDAEQKVEPSVPGEVVRALGDTAITRDQERFDAFPVLEIARRELRETTAPVGDGAAGQTRGNQEMKQSRAIIPEHARITKRARRITFAWRRKWIRQGLLEVDAVRAGREAEVLRAIHAPGRIVPPKDPVMVKDRPRADRSFIFVGDCDGQGMMGPVPQVGGGGVRPLMAAQPLLPLMMVFVQEVIQVKYAVLEEGHAVANKELPGRPVILHVLRGCSACRPRRQYGAGSHDCFPQAFRKHPDAGLPETIHDTDLS